MASPDPSPSTTKQHPIFARVHPRPCPAMEPQGGIHHRRAPHAGLAGPMLEVGAGNGLLFANYSPVVTDALAVAPEPYPRALARAAAAQARGCMRQPLISAALALHAQPDSPEGDAIQWPGRSCRATRPGGRR